MTTARVPCRSTPATTSSAVLVASKRVVMRLMTATLLPGSMLDPGPRPDPAAPRRTARRRARAVGRGCRWTTSSRGPCRAGPAPGRAHRGVGGADRRLAPAPAAGRALGRGLRPDHRRRRAAHRAHRHHPGGRHLARAAAVAQPRDRRTARPTTTPPPAPRWRSGCTRSPRAAPASARGWPRPSGAAVATGAVPDLHRLGSIGTGDLVPLAQLGLTLVGERPWRSGAVAPVATVDDGDALPFMSSNALTLATAAARAPAAGPARRRRREGHRPVRHGAAGLAAGLRPAGARRPPGRLPAGRRPPADGAADPGRLGAGPGAGPVRRCAPCPRCTHRSSTR